MMLSSTILCRVSILLGICGLTTTTTLGTSNIIEEETPTPNGTTSQSTSSQQGIVFKLHSFSSSKEEQGMEYWMPPSDASVLRDIGVNIADNKEEQHQLWPEAEMLFPTGRRPRRRGLGALMEEDAIKQDEEASILDATSQQRELLLSSFCTRRCLFSCPCSGYECKRSSWFSLFGRCEAPLDPKTCPAPTGSVSGYCGECLQSIVTTQINFEDGDWYCDYYRACSAGTPPASCATSQATGNCFAEDLPTTYFTYDTLPTGPYTIGQCGPYVEKRRRDLRSFFFEEDNAQEEEEDNLKGVRGIEEGQQEATSSQVLLSTSRNPNQDLLAFVRIPKTGSTSLLNFMDYARRMYPWDFHMLLPKEHQTKKSGPRVAGCIFGYAAHESHLQQSPDEQKKLFWNRCPHFTYAQLIEHWAKSLPLWSSSSAVSAPSTMAMDKATAVGSTSNSLDDQSSTVGVDGTATAAETTTRTTMTATTSTTTTASTPGELIPPPPRAAPVTTLTLNAFTMVRDPFDRLVSYFYYLRKFTDKDEFLKHTATEAQYELVKANDLHGWMELLHTEGGGCGLELPYQYKYIHEDIDSAINLIQYDASPARVFVLLTECYEASLHLLAATYDGFEDGYVDKFVQSELYTSNSNKDSYDDKLDTKDLSLLREKAMVWFADDYRFYDVAVEQFQIGLSKSSTTIDQTVLSTCMYWKKDTEL